MHRLTLDMGRTLHCGKMTLPLYDGGDQISNHRAGLPKQTNQMSGAEIQKEDNMLITIDMIKASRQKTASLVLIDIIIWVAWPDMRHFEIFKGEKE